MGEIAQLRPRSLVGALLSRFQFLQRAGITFGGKRDLYEAFGYARELTPKDFRDRYARDGIAARVIDCYPKATWREGAYLQEDEDPKITTPFEQAWEDFDKRLGAWPMFERLDKLARLSTYAVLLIGAQDGNLEVELPKGKSPDQILFLSAFSGGGGLAEVGATGEIGFVDATIRDFVTDPKDSRFGLPLTYQLRRIDATSPSLTRPVHWSRIIHVAEGLLDNDVFGIPQLQDVWNRFDDLDKVTGGGAEAFFQRANKGINLNLDKDVEMQEADAKKLASEVEDYIHGITRVLKTRAMTVQELGSDVANFSQPAEAIITQIAGAKGIPKRILLGSEMGKLASTQDSDNWNTQVQDRRSSYAGPRIVRPFLDRLITYGYFPAPKEYIIVWPEVSNLTETEKADGATKWATTNQTAGVTVFTPEEIRDHWYQMDPLTPDQLDKAKAQKEAEAPPPPPMPPGFGGKGGPPKPPKPGDKVLPFGKPRAAEEAQDRLDELVAVLEAALEEGDLDTVDAVLGVDRTLGDRFGHQFHGNQWVNAMATEDVDVTDPEFVNHLRSTAYKSGVYYSTKAHMETIQQKIGRPTTLVRGQVGGKGFGFYHIEDEAGRRFGPHGWRSLGGPGSGNFGHSGRPGEQGGSLADGMSSTAQFKQSRYEVDAAERSFGDLRWRTETGEAMNAGDVPPERTKAGDYVVYHGTSSAAVDSIEKTGLRPDSVGAVGFATTPGSAKMMGGFHGRDSVTLRLVIDKDFMEQHTHVTHESSLSRDLFLLHHPEGGSFSIPRSAIKEIKALGGPGSGNFGHAGRPGEQGGSADAGAIDAKAKEISDTEGWVKHSEVFGGQINYPGNVDKDLANEKDSFSRLVPFKELVATQDYTGAEKSAKIAKGGQRLDLVHVSRVGDKWAILDGHHQAVAAFLRGQDAVRVRVHERTARKAKALEGEGELESLGGPGSGNFGHKGRPGAVGGSVVVGKGGAPGPTPPDPPIAPPGAPGPVPKAPVVVVAPVPVPTPAPLQVTPAPTIVTVPPGDPGQTAPVSFQSVFDPAMVRTVNFSPTMTPAQAEAKRVAIVAETHRMLQQYPGLAYMYGPQSPTGSMAKMELTLHARPEANKTKTFTTYGRYTWDNVPSHPPHLQVALERTWEGPLKLSSGRNKVWSVSTNSGALATFRHEVGHDVHLRLLGRQARLEWDGIYNGMRRTGGGNYSQKIASNVTKYAQKNHKELFSESFAAYTHPGYKAGTLPPAIETFMKTHVGERRVP